ncbi:MAG: transcription termination/antitermination protein NusA [Verrucomicrobia bacterium]|nr:MAG: transcription termination/antitermination protein NusA [Verrucomicrobiota bacterium]
MNAEFLAVLEYWEKEKGIPKERLLNAVEEALLAAAKKAVGPARELRVSIDPKAGDIKAWAKLMVAERIVSKHDQISVFDARRAGFPDAKQGDEIEVEVTPAGFGRIAAQFAKQALMQQVRRAEKELIFAEFKDRVGDIVSGTVRRFERSDVVLDLGKFEALMPNRERVPTEEYQIGERIRCYVKDIEQTPRGPEIILSRADPQFVLKLFRLEVSEINDNTIEVKGIAREPGFRTKLAVYSRDSKVDPVGACVGLRGQRVKNIVRELNNEKVDIIPWSPDVKTFVGNALAPAKLKSFQIDEPNHRVYVRCAADQLSLAIGKRGQNTRLTERITGWRITIEPEADAVSGFADKVEHAIREFTVIPGISREHAQVLVNAGFHSVEDLSQVEIVDLQALPEIGDAAASILEAARGEMTRRNTGENGTPA